MKTLIIAGVMLLLCACGGSAPAPQVDYDAAMSEQMKSLGAFSGAVGPLLDDPKLSDQAWTLQVAEQSSVISTAYESVAALKPPADQLSKHLAVLSGMGDCAAAMKVLTLAADEDRVDFVPASIGLVNRCTAKLTAAANQ